MEKWDYSVIETKGGDLLALQEMLTLQGEQGWELVSATVLHVGEGHGAHSYDQYTLFFKRLRR
jgi:hypothetical protein